jgi:hypothetical protein
MTPGPGRKLTPGRIAAWAVAVVVALVALFFLFQLVETFLPANF